MFKCDLTAIFVFLFFAIFGQESTDSLEKKKVKYFGFPIVAYAPETKYVLGVYGVLSFQLGPDSCETRISTIQTGVAYTQMKQVLLFLPYQLWTKNDKFNIYGELGYYKYTYYNWGIGSTSSDQNKHPFEAKFPRFRMHALYQLKKAYFFGPRVGFDAYEISFKDSNSLAFQEKSIGYQGGRVANLGLVFKFDNRDNQFSPSKGVFLEAQTHTDQHFFGSSFQNVRWTFDVSTYFTRKNRTLAINFYHQGNLGLVPFYQLALLGGNKKMRGYFEGRYRDMHQLVFQAEYRIPIYKRFGATGFISTGQVFNTLESIFETKPKVGYGLGLRLCIDKLQKINLRFDLARGDQNLNFYLTLFEAF